VSFSGVVTVLQLMVLEIDISLAELSIAMCAACFSALSLVVLNKSVKLPLIKTSDNRTSFTNTMNENKIVKRSIYNKIRLQYKMSQIGRRSQALKIH